jgi:hypothetical protein
MRFSSILRYLLGLLSIIIPRYPHQLPAPKLDIIGLIVLVFLPDQHKDVK